MLTLSACLLSGVILAIFINTDSTKKPSVNSVDPVDVKNTLSEQEIMYAYAYSQGYNAFVTQMDRADLLINNKAYSYTSEKEKSEIEKDLEARAYTEGYHNAANSLYCPRVN